MQITSCKTVTYIMLLLKTLRSDTDPFIPQECFRSLPSLTTSNEREVFVARGLSHAITMLPSNVRRTAAKSQTCSNAAMQQCSNAAMQQCSNAAMQQCSNAAMQQCSNAAMQQCSNAAMQQCSNAAMQQCSNAAMQQCSNAAMQQCSNAAILTEPLRFSSQLRDCKTKSQYN